MAACLMSASVPMFSAAVDHQEEYSCKVEARKCMSDLDVAQAKMKKMNEKIKKGAKYSEEDMKKLKKSISELQQAIDNMKPMQ
jgi:seryl-tRNA synthetase